MLMWIWTMKFIAARLRHERDDVRRRP